MSKSGTIQQRSGSLSSVGALDGMNSAEQITAEELYQRYLGDVCCYVVRQVGRIEEAEDIIAEVFAAATAGLHRFRSQCPPRLWLLSIARRKIIDAGRRRAARRESLVSELDVDGVEAAAFWGAMA